MVYGYNTTVKRLETQSQWNEQVFTNILNLNGIRQNAYKTGPIKNRFCLC